jgi:hypothetical protein
MLWTERLDVSEVFGMASQVAKTANIFVQELIHLGRICGFAANSHLRQLTDGTALKESVFVNGGYLLPISMTIWVNAQKVIRSAVLTAMVIMVPGTVSGSHA